jgi:hypothetical protein
MMEFFFMGRRMLEHEGKKNDSAKEWKIVGVLRIVGRWRKMLEYKE